MIIVVFVTIPEEKAKNLARKLLTQRVCACVNIISGVESLYWWEGEIQTSTESLMMIKTKEVLYEKLKVLIENNHPYDVPEIIAVDIDKINPKYLDWLNKEANAKPYSE